MKPFITLLLALSLLEYQGAGACDCDSILESVAQSDSSIGKILKRGTFMDSAVTIFSDTSQSLSAPDLSFQITDSQRVILAVLDSVCAFKALLVATDLPEGEYWLYIDHDLLIRHSHDWGYDRFHGVRCHKFLLTRGSDCELREVLLLK